MSRKMQNKQVDPREIVNRRLEERTNEALKQKNEQFARDHRHTTNQQLIDYVKQCAQDLGHTPHKDEIIGGHYIAHRFGGWGTVLYFTHLPPCGRGPLPNGRKIYRQELKNQARLYRAERAAMKKEREADRQQRQQMAKEADAERRERDRLWGQEHQSDTDEQLMAYVRQCAGKLGRTPYAREVVGGEYIRKRFGGWSIILTAAEIPLPPDMKPPTEKMMKCYWSSRKAQM